MLHHQWSGPTKGGKKSQFKVLIVYGLTATRQVFFSNLQSEQQTVWLVDHLKAMSEVLTSFIQHNKSVLRHAEPKPAGGQLLLTFSSSESNSMLSS